MKSAEFVERRTLAERNANDIPVTGTQSLVESENGLDRIRAAAMREPDLQFNNLYHHLTELRLHVYQEQRYKPQPSLRISKK